MCSLAEYFAVDIVSPERLEYRNGYIVAQAVGSGKHERIKNNAEPTHFVLIDSRKQLMMSHTWGEDGRFVVDGPIESLAMPSLGALTLDAV